MVAALELKNHCSREGGKGRASESAREMDVWEEKDVFGWRLQEAKDEDGQAEKKGETKRTGSVQAAGRDSGGQVWAGREMTFDGSSPAPEKQEL